MESTNTDATPAAPTKDMFTLLKNAFAGKSELQLSELVTSSGLSEAEVREYLAKNPLYSLNEESQKITKGQVLRLKLYIIDAEADVEKPVKEIIPLFEAVVPDIPYVRFNKNAGHIVVEEDRAQEMDKLKAGLDVDGVKLTVREPDVEDKRKFSRDHAVHLEGILRGKLGKGVAFIVDGLLNTKKGIYLGYRKFKSITELKDYFGRYLKSAAVGQTVDEPEASLLKELLKYHARGDEKVKDIERFEVNMHPEYKDTKCFFIVKHDGTKEDFSYVKCVKKISAMVKTN